MAPKSLATLFSSDEGRAVKTSKCNPGLFTRKKNGIFSRPPGRTVSEGDRASGVWHTGTGYAARSSYCNDPFSLKVTRKTNKGVRSLPYSNLALRLPLLSISTTVDTYLRGTLGRDCCEGLIEIS